MTKTVKELTPGDKVWGAIVTGPPVPASRWFGIQRVNLPIVYTFFSDNHLWVENEGYITVPANKTVKVED